MTIARMITAVRLIGNPFPVPCPTTTRPVELHRTPVYFCLKESRAWERFYWRPGWPGKE
jgi:hypothetical protein